MIKVEIFQGELVDPASEIAYWDQFMHVKGILHDRNIHDRLQTDLIEYIWALVGNLVNPLIYFI
jgi:hypothetical protein